MEKGILELDATTLARKIREGVITSEQATKAYIEHLQAVNPALNVLVEDRFEAALEEARACDRQLQQGQAQGRLFGVPISMKESFDVAGMKTTGGLVHRRDHVATVDAEAVAKLRAEGAVLLGKTNTPTLCFCQESDNKLYGRTNNPWDVRRTAGGSSGGEGALMAVGGAAVGLGSDIGGSIRFPAHFNGVIGFKSGDKQASQVGHFPYVGHPLQERMLGIGALAKSVNDAELIHDIVSVTPPPQVDASRFRIVLPPMHRKVPLGADTARLVEEVATALGEAHGVERAFPPLFEQMAQMWQLIMSIDGGASMAELAFSMERPRPVREYMREVMSGNSEIHHYLTWALIGANLFKPSSKQEEQLRAALDQADRESERFFHDTVLVMPVYHSATLPHGVVYRQIFSIQKTFQRYMPYVAVANVLGLPALIVPVGTDAYGLPISVQLVSKVGNERALFHVGRMLEERFRGYVRCTAHDGQGVRG